MNVERTHGKSVSDRVEAHDCVEIFRAAPDGILVIDAGGKIVGANPQACRLFGYGPETLVGMGVDDLVPERFRTEHAAHRTAYADDPHSRPMGIGLELLGLHSDGHEIPVEISLSPLPSLQGKRVICTVRDVTEQRRYREFGRAALRAAEEERKRLALELHDDMAQRLAALLLRVRLASETETPQRRDALLAELREELVDTAAALHRIARGLRPPALAEAGLEAAIRADVRSRDVLLQLAVVIHAHLIAVVADLQDGIAHITEDRRHIIHRALDDIPPTLGGQLLQLLNPGLVRLIDVNGTLFRPYGLDQAGRLFALGHEILIHGFC